MKTTLNKIRAHLPCADGWQKLLKHLGKSGPDDQELDLLAVLESNGFDDALWCLRAVDVFDREKRLFAVWCARQVEHLNSDPRIKACNDMAERYANSLCTNNDLQGACRAAYATDAAHATAAAYAVAYAAAYAASYTASAAYAAAAYTTAAYATAERQKAREAQEKEFRRMLQEGYP
jgi:hypothetical protein